MFEAKGLITPVVTALTEDEKFNPGVYAEFIDHLITAGVDGIFPHRKRSWRSSVRQCGQSTVAFPSMRVRVV